VPKARKQQPPIRPPKPADESRPSLLELDRFSTENLSQWRRLSGDLDELNDLLYFGVEPQRQRFYSEMMEALQSVAPTPLSFKRWARVVTYRYSLTPLSAAGSLTDYGGRFNIGRDVDKAMRAPWPALYIGEDFETAFREKFQLSRDERVDGLSPEELALTSSFSATYLDGHLEQVFDLDQPGALDALCAVLSKMKLPSEAHKIQRRLKIPASGVFMIRTVKRLRSETLTKNWRVMPVQFGLPAPSQILASLILDAGFEAIRYPSTKGNGSCIAVFPHKLASDSSYVALSDAPPPGVTHTKLDMNSAEDLCGWELLRPAQRPTDS
jgi:hypothetical protein